ncbi:hypothetical protein CGRA01v4_06009 [Colletotrichum graminicola]|uniref:Uncharacterized protein n=1 Tax=Colletotrichum graminicola (strain M1.001 / M2 / FGSC 10212) TaxID=645133 RepID=E3QYV1_COLGM|nr:uncharacterized protein GLRG_11183 [Colletotrichum graminicola M1.001]EFQ36039.1 hypothetical protein GLRG_11183 [Colletotrichum graminicola M1.001]WDK14728.1 hypothetical protein CGRA01v4_06009 [Colletotrichum graminicola]
MSRHSEKCSTAAAYAERVFQQLEDNRPSDAPDGFSDPAPEEPTSGQSKTTSDQSRPVRSNTVGSPDMYAQSKDGKSNAQRAGSVGHSHVQQLIASYEARYRRTEELALAAERRGREVTAAGGTPSQASTPAVQQESPCFCPACIADDEKEWAEAIELEADS